MTSHMIENTCDPFNRVVWHDSKLRSVRLIRKDDLDEVLLDVDLQGLPGREFTPMTVALTDAIFFFRNIDLQGKRECSDDISSAKCDIKTPLMSNIQNDRLRHSADPLAGYYHFSVSLIPPDGTLDIIASGFRLETREGGS